MCSTMSLLVGVCGDFPWHCSYPDREVTCAGWELSVEPYWQMPVAKRQMKIVVGLSST
jgi:hypothetical protein